MNTLSFLTLGKSVGFTDEAKEKFGVNGDIFVVHKIDYVNHVPRIVHLVPRPKIRGVEIDSISPNWLCAKTKAEVT
ncbi:MAG: hypothetical protein V4438_00205 [Patescibacteria group bacterium]